MNQTICDACGAVIKNQDNHQSNVWDMSTTMNMSITRVNADICPNCWNKIKRKEAK